LISRSSCGAYKFSCDFTERRALYLAGTELRVTEMEEEGRISATPL